MSKYELTFADLFESSAPLSTAKGEPGKTTSPYTDKSHLTNDTLKDVAVADEGKATTAKSAPKKSPVSSEEPKEPATKGEPEAAKTHKAPEHKKAPVTSEEPKEQKPVEESLNLNADDMFEHDMAAGEIAMTADFLKQLLADIQGAGLSEDQISQVVDACANAAGEDRTLDVADIGAVMEYLGGGAASDEEGYDDVATVDDDEIEDLDAEPEVEADGDIADAEDGEEHEGKEELFGGLEECGCDGEKLDEAVFVAGIPYAGLRAQTDDTIEEDELLVMRRLAGIKGY